MEIQSPKPVALQSNLGLFMSLPVMIPDGLFSDAVFLYAVFWLISWPFSFSFNAL